MLTILIHNSYSYILYNGTKVNRRALEKSLGFQPKGFETSDSYLAGTWDGWSTLLKKDDSFPTGLVSCAVGYFRENGVPYKIQDERKPAHSPKVWKWIGHELRPYQEEAINNAIRAGRGSIVIGTGGGKMLVAAGIIQRLGLRTLLLVNSKEAVWDTANEIRSSVSGPTIVEWASKDGLTGDVTVATMQSLYSCHRREGIESPLVQLLSKCDVIITDEMHHSASEEWFGVMMETSAFYRFGMTGTLRRMDYKNIHLQAIAGRRVCDFPVRWLIDNGYLCDVDVFFHEAPPHHDPARMATVASEYVYDEAITLNHSRNRRILDLISANPEEKSTLIIVSRVRHGEVLYELAQERGLPCEFVTGKTPTKQRRQLKEDMVSGKVKYVIATSMYDESVNTPVWKRCFNVGGFSKENAQVQRLGRILRKVGNMRAEFHDFLDTFEGRMHEHAEKRKKYLEMEGHFVRVVPNECF